MADKEDGKTPPKPTTKPAPPEITLVKGGDKTGGKGGK
jgi:hypothetical protein